MNNPLLSPRWQRLVRRTMAGLAMGALAGVQLQAADATAPAAPAATTPAPAGTWYVFSPPKEGEVVTSALRVKLLTAAKTFVERDNPTLLAMLTSADNPFYLKLPPPPVATVSNSTTGASAEPAGPPKLSDDDKLKQVADAVKPTGMVAAGNIRLVTFAKRDAVQVGQSFNVQFPNESTITTILVVDANDSSCVLKLGNATLSADYVSNASAAPAARPATPAAPAAPANPSPSN